MMSRVFGSMKVVAALFIGGTLSCAPGFGATLYTVTPIFDPLPNSSFYPSDINDSGTVVGRIDNVPVAGYFGHAAEFRNGVLTDLTPGSRNDSYATGINNSGEIAAFVGFPGTPPDYFDEFHSGQILVPAGLNLVGAVNAGRVNNLGSVVGQSAPVFFYTASYWDPDGTVHVIGTLGGIISSAADVNDHGLIVGSSRISNDPNDQTEHAFAYDSQGARTLIDLDPLGGSSGASSVNNSGVIVGGASDSSGVFAFSYEDGVLTALGLGCVASDINDSGVIVGSCDITVVPGTAVLFEGGSTVALSSLIDPNSGWTLDEVSAINNQGQITGYGEYKGQTTGYLLTPLAETPEPTTLWMAIGGMLLVLLRRSRGLKILP